jgi:protein ImuA
MSIMGAAPTADGAEQAQPVEPGFSSLLGNRFGKTRFHELQQSLRAAAGAASGTVATGHAALDATLPGGGWPLGAITELCPVAPGIGELTLLMPALARLGRSGKQLVWIAPPHLPYPPALAGHGLPLAQLLQVHVREAREVAWAAEQALRCPAVGAVLAWPGLLDDRAVRRLQLAAETGGGCGMLYRDPAVLAQPSPAALRVHLSPEGAGLRLELRKVRGGNPHVVVVHPAAAAGS